MRAINIDVHELMANKDQLRSSLSWSVHNHHLHIKAKCDCSEFTYGRPCEHLWTLLNYFEERNQSLDENFSVTFQLEHSAQYPPPTKTDPRAREWLLLLKKDLRNLEEGGVEASVTNEKREKVEIWYGINWDSPGPTPGRNEMAINLYAKSIMQNKLKPFYPSEENLEKCFYAEDKTLVTLLKYMIPTTLSPYWRQKLGRHKRSVCFIPLESAYKILFDLGSTGRLFVNDNRQPQTNLPDSTISITTKDKVYLYLDIQREHDSYSLGLIGKCYNEEIDLRGLNLDLTRRLALSNNRIFTLVTPSFFNLSLKSLLEEKRLFVTGEIINELRSELLALEDKSSVFDYVTNGDLIYDKVKDLSPAFIFQIEVHKENDTTLLMGNLNVHYPQENTTLFTLLSSDPINQRDDYIFRRDLVAENNILSAVDNLTGLTPRSFSTPGRYFVDSTALIKLVSNLEELAIPTYIDEKKISAAKSYYSSIKKEADWFEVKNHLQFNDESFEGINLNELKTLDGVTGLGLISLGGNQYGMLPEDWISKQIALKQMARVEGDKVYLHHSQALTLDLLLEENRDRLENFSWGEIKEKSNNTFKGPLQNPSPFVMAQLRDYQLEGVNWFLYLNKLELGGCLADDMGLGKTLQTLCFLEQLRHSQNEQLPHLIVVPKTLLGNWKNEAQKFTPKLLLSICDGTPAEREVHYKSLVEGSATQVTVITYGTLLRDIESLRKVPFQTFILDEAQYIKNEETLTYKACLLIKARARFALSGTPAQNRLTELTSLFRLLIPKIINRRLPTNTLDRSDSAIKDKVLKGLSAFILRRTKEEVLTELPQKIETILKVEMEDDHKEFYESLKRTFQEQFRTKEKNGEELARVHPLEALLRLRQAACHPRLISSKYTGSSSKFKILIDQLQEITQCGAKALVFSQFTDLLELLRRDLSKLGIPSLTLTGKTTKRDAVVTEFNDQQEGCVFLLSLKAAGVGLNLTSANYTFILDPWWNPSQEAQAIDRAHRMGQQRTVFSYKLITEGTVEEKILKLQDTKRSLVDSVQSMDEFSPDQSYQLMQILMQS